MDGTTKPAPEKWSEPEAARDDVKVDASPLRCPYCHEGVDTSAPEWVACSGCLARHHGACWDERGSCSSCGGAKRLVADERRPPSDPEVAAMVARGDRAAALQALRARGLDPRAAEVAVDVAQAAAAATGVRLVQPGEAQGDPGRLPEVAGWSAQALVVLAAALVALLAEAEAGVVIGALGLALGVSGLIAGCILGGSIWSRLGRLCKGLFAAGAVGLAVLAVEVTNAPAHRPSPALFLLGLLVAVASAAFAVRAARGRGGPKGS